MKYSIVCILLIAGLVGSSTAFLDVFRPQGKLSCYLLITVPVKPKFEYFWFQSLDAKLAANQDRYNRRTHSVWVDAPDPSMCGSQLISPYGRCCLEGYYDNVYQWRMWPEERKIQENRNLWQQAKYSGDPQYRVWTDAPQRYCRDNSGFF